MAYLATHDYHEDKNFVDKWLYTMRTGEMDLSWMNAKTEKVKTRPQNARRGLTYRDLDIGTYGFTDADMEAEFDIGSFKGAPGGASRMRLRDLIAALEETYCRTFGTEYMYMSDTPQKRFIQERIEPLRARPNYPPDFRRHILERLTAAEWLGIASIGVGLVIVSVRAWLASRRGEREVIEAPAIEGG